MKTTRQTIIDFAIAIMFVVFIATGALKAIGTLALQPDRPLLAIILDWALLAVIVASIAFGAYGVRRILKNADAVRKARQDRLDKIREINRNIEVRPRG
ncbi:hypothetical protein SEA_HIRKO_78 [Arthrobacter phage Hirko]|nr:hypothetical protein SEA_HIRKO_78 [Arthrobacter phage Hirko]